MAIQDVTTLGFGGTELFYVVTLGFTISPQEVVVDLVPLLDGGGVLLVAPERTLVPECGPRGLQVNTPERTLVMPMKQGGR